MQADNGKLYGMTSSGGITYGGVIFEYDMINDTVIKKHDFAYSGPTCIGRYPQYNNLTDGGAGILYGMAYRGGSNDRGTLFEYNLASGVLTKRHDFANGLPGKYPWGSLVVAAPGKLVGMTYEGGTTGKGLLFEYDTLTATVTNILDFDGSNGDSPYHTSLTKIYVSAEWTGVNSTDWHDAGNWLHGEVPWPITSVIIPDVSAGSGAFPVISSNVMVSAININPNAVVNVQNGSVLIIGTEE